MTPTDVLVDAIAGEVVRRSETFQPGHVRPPSVYTMPLEDGDMARRRGQRKGHLYKKSGSWILRWREYVPGDPKPRQVSEAIARYVGPGAITKREAERIAWVDYLSKLDARSTRPSSSMTLKNFIGAAFNVQIVERKKPSTKKHYGYIIGAFIIPAMGERRLCDIGRNDVEVLVSDVLKTKSVQTASHVKNALSRIFRHAKELRVYGEENPAARVDCGELVHDRRPSLTWEQATRALGALASPLREMAWLSVETSMNAAEMCGLKRKWANLTPGMKEVDGEVMAPYTIAVRENWYEGQRGSLKRGKRRRNCPITDELARDLAALIGGSPFAGEDFPVFCSKNGTPVDAHNASHRAFTPLARKLGFAVTWHSFRRAHSTFVGQVDGVSVEDRVKTMGHSDSATTLYYSVEDIERRRRIPEQIRERLAGGKLQLVKGTA